MNKRECGECTLCCILPPIPSMNSPAGEVCSACKNSKCSIYKDRPQECKDFNCIWLLSPVLGEELRPDKCGTVFELYEGQKTVVALAENESWKTGELHKLISQMLIDGYVVWVMQGKERNLLLPNNMTEEEATIKLKDAWRNRLWPLLPTQKI